MVGEPVKEAVSVFMAPFLSCLAITILLFLKEERERGEGVEEGEGEGEKGGREG